jgi:hypothetical protein
MLTGPGHHRCHRIRRPVVAAAAEQLGNGRAAVRGSAPAWEAARGTSRARRADGVPAPARRARILPPGRPSCLEPITATAGVPSRARPAFGPWRSTAHGACIACAQTERHGFEPSTSASANPRNPGVGNQILKGSKSRPVMAGGQRETLPGQVRKPLVCSARCREKGPRDCGRRPGGRALRVGPARRARSRPAPRPVAAAGRRRPGDAGSGRRRRVRAPGTPRPFSSVRYQRERARRTCCGRPHRRNLHRVTASLMPVKEPLDQPPVPPLALHEHGGAPAPTAAEESRATLVLACGERAGCRVRPGRLATVAVTRPLRAAHIFLIFRYRRSQPDPRQCGRHRAMTVLMIRPVSHALLR